VDILPFYRKNLVRVLVVAVALFCYFFITTIDDVLVFVALLIDRFVLLKVGSGDVARYFADGGRLLTCASCGTFFITLLIYLEVHKT
jgi:hypothetical protein